MSYKETYDQLVKRQPKVINVPNDELIRYKNNDDYHASLQFKSLINKKDYVAMTQLTKKLLKSNSKLFHENRALKAKLLMKKNGELKDFKRQLKAEKHGKKVFDLKNAY